MEYRRFILEVIKNMVWIFWILAYLMGFGIFGIVPILLFKEYIDSPILGTILAFIWSIFYISLVISIIYAWLNKDE